MPRNQGIRLVAMIFASWIRDKLKGYSRHIEYAMEAAEKTGLFPRVCVDGKWTAISGASESLTKTAA